MRSFAWFSLNLCFVIVLFWTLLQATVITSQEVFPCAQDLVFSSQILQTSQAGHFGLKSSNAAASDITESESSVSPLIIPVIFNILQNGTKGYVPYEGLQAQIDHANLAYAGMQNLNTSANTRIRLVLQAVHYWDDPVMHEQCEVLDFQTPAIRDLQVSSRYAINVFTCSMYKYSGWAWPCYCSENMNFESKGGFFISYKYIPAVPGKWNPASVGGVPQRVGDTFVHELGHSLGLLHPATGGCSLPNDYVEDTPAEANMHGAWNECPTDLDTCPDMPGNDPVKNFMDYSEDQCRDSFTPGQVTRMHDYISQYLPTIRSMQYVWQCVGKQHGKNDSYALCKSPCTLQTTPRGQKSPAKGWCYVYGGSTDFGNPSQNWGECVCPGTPEHLAIPGLPNISKFTCKGKACAVARWELDGATCIPPSTWGEATTACTNMGYTLCTASQISSGLGKDTIADTPCASIQSVWTSTPCNRQMTKFYAANILNRGKTCKTANAKTKYPALCCYKP